MKYANDIERNRIAHQALRATTLAEIEIATRELDQWVDDHPDDWGIRDAYEVLENMTEIAQEQQAGKIASREVAVLV